MNTVHAFFKIIEGKEAEADHSRIARLERIAGVQVRRIEAMGTTLADGILYVWED